MTIDDSNVTLTDLIDARTLQKVQDAFAKATGVAALTVDMDGPVTTLSEGTHFCMNLTRGSKVGAERCNQCDLQGGKDAIRTGRPSVYYCHGGLMDFAAPILLGNRQIGSLLGGQVLPEAADENKFRRIADEIGVPQDEYINALRRIKILPKSQIEAAAELLYVIGNALSDVGYQKFQNKRSGQAVIDVSMTMRSKIKEAMNHIKLVHDNNEDMRSSFAGLLTASDASMDRIADTDSVVKYIGTISLQTRLLGMNASVEAAHARELGRGFAIIAQEVRRLAETSEDQSKKIETVLSDIKSSVVDIRNSVNRTSENVAKNSEVTQQMSKLINEIDEVAASLSLKNI